MKNALIDPRMPAMAITSWDNSQTPSLPVYTPMPNTGRVAQVEPDIFPVAEPLFWMECADDVEADTWFYDLDTKSISKILLPPKVAADNQPVASGVQTL